MMRGAADARRDARHEDVSVGGPRPREPSTNWGEVRQFDDARVIVLFVRFLRCPVEDVWAAVTEPAQRAVWVPGIRFEPPRRLQMGTMCFDLAPTDSGCLLRFSDRLWFDDKRSKAKFANTVFAGWHRFLDTLEIWLDERVSALDLEEPDYAVIEVAGRDRL